MSQVTPPKSALILQFPARVKQVSEVRELKAKLKAALKAAIDRGYFDSFGEEVAYASLLRQYQNHPHRTEANVFPTVTQLEWGDW